MAVDLQVSTGMCCAVDIKRGGLLLHEHASTTLPPILLTATVTLARTIVAGRALVDCWTLLEHWHLAAATPFGELASA